MKRFYLFNDYNIYFQSVQYAESYKFFVLYEGIFDSFNGLCEI